MQPTSSTKRPRAERLSSSKSDSILSNASAYQLSVTGGGGDPARERALDLLRKLLVPSEELDASNTDRDSISNLKGTDTNKADGEQPEDESEEQEFKPTKRRRGETETDPAEDLENALYAKHFPNGGIKAYHSAVRSLLSSLKKPHNKHFVDKAISGEIYAPTLLDLPADAFLSQEQLAERDKARAEGLAQCLNKANEKDAFPHFDAAIVCDACGNEGCYYAVLRDSWAWPRCSGNGGMMRPDTGKTILAKCKKCGMTSQKDGYV